MRNTDNGDRNNMKLLGFGTLTLRAEADPALAVVEVVQPLGVGAEMRATVGFLFHGDGSGGTGA